MSFGNRLKNARKKQGIKQIELAKKMETTPQNLSQYENNNRKPSKDMLKKLANALDLGYSYTNNGEPYFYDFVDTIEPADSENNLFNRSQYADAVNDSEINMNNKELQNFLERYSIPKKNSAVYDFGTEDYKIYIEINENLGKLNLKGKREANQRIEEMTHISKYQANTTEE
jgi:transcriptional regulator with XRE-family HTH domain